MRTNWQIAHVIDWIMILQDVNQFTSAVKIVPKVTIIITFILYNYKNAFVVIVLTEGVRDPGSKPSTLVVALGSSLGLLMLGGALGTVLMIILVVVYRNYKLRLCGNKANSSVVVILVDLVSCMTCELLFSTV